MTLPNAILQLLIDQSKAPHEYINPNFLQELTDLLDGYYELEDAGVDKWVQSMFGA